MNNKIYSNIVTEKRVREVQMDTLNIISDALVKSFGPMGSHTAIIKQSGQDTSLLYTKDGKTIVQNIQFKDPIERSVQDLLTELTRYVVKEVGDGTTSAILICRYIFKWLCEEANMTNCTPSDTIKKFNDVINEIKKRIKDSARECTIDDIYNIALISTNNNVEISSTIKNIYTEFGLDTYIDIGSSNTVDNIIKSYDGMVFDTGFSNNCFINNRSNNSCVLRNPRIYAFKDAIDTPEMISLLDSIISNNIIKALAPNSVYEMIPTVILCEQRITPDASSYLTKVAELMNNRNDIPLLIVSQIFQYDLYEDAIMMCGCKWIKKYLNPDIQKADIESGLAPTTETIVDFYGTADEVMATVDYTKIINPKDMHNEDGTYSNKYNSMLAFLETELENSIANNDGIEKIGKLKRRINSFKGNMIDFLIGGVTESDKENLRAAVEDAVLNCRSAAKYGVGYGANYMALKTIFEMNKDPMYLDNSIVKILCKSYFELSETLYKSVYGDEAHQIVMNSIEHGCPLNIRTNQFDKTVLSSIKSDITILETVGRILTLMFTCNQYLVQSPMHNIYEEI